MSSLVTVTNISSDSNNRSILAKISKNSGNKQIAKKLAFEDDSFDHEKNASYQSLRIH